MIATSLANEKWRDGKWMQMMVKKDSGGYDQFGACQGQVKVYSNDLSPYVEGLLPEVEVIELSLPGLRQRRWGPIKSQHLHRTGVFIGIIEDGCVFEVGAMSGKIGLTQFVTFINNKTGLSLRLISVHNLETFVLLTAEFVRSTGLTLTSQHLASTRTSYQKQQQLKFKSEVERLLLSLTLRTAQRFRYVVDLKRKDGTLSSYQLKSSSTVLLAQVVQYFGIQRTSTSSMFKRFQQRSKESSIVATIRRPTNFWFRLLIRKLKAFWFQVVKDLRWLC